MGPAQYKIAAVGRRWSILHDGQPEGDYDTKEAAFEAAVIAASLAVREGHEVQISVPSREAGAGTTTGIPLKG
jgi:hypothetical protein